MPDASLFSIISRIPLLTICMLAADFFSKWTFIKNSFRNTIRVSNSMYPDQKQHSVSPDLDPNCLLRLSAAGQVKISIFLVKINFFPMYANIFLGCRASAYFKI